ncbi:methyltransferase family protein [Roseitranquillus sediminis]|uniref:methyltransferase family protein n=1 Tax=Roseitranquillus sediminis TaxID=2809051 RepID=UPI001D0C2A21|nr:isoprenylcysteine carboxylmethyltransferase family protein [Roseitranquillus sediminis]MBM9595355.1 isoprenylcysteine carboxylmethyltransferase family protein [Roseitranquillus sediminis]
MPPVWLAACLLAGWLQARIAPAPDLGLWADAGGWVLLGLAALLMAKAALQFRRYRTTIIPGESPDALITGGIFRYSRNPIYLADLLILAALGLIWSSLLALFLVPVLFVVLDRRFIRYEERRLEEAFGARFEEYAGRTRRWI